MSRTGTFEEQWSHLIKPIHQFYKARVWPVPPGSWRLRPRSHVFDPCLTFWGMAALPDPRAENGISYRTFWFAFPEPPYLHPDREYFDGEAVCVNYEDILADVLAPGIRFQATANGQDVTANVELLSVIEKA
jgi:hypothetical protein